MELGRSGVNRRSRYAEVYTMSLGAPTFIGFGFMGYGYEATACNFAFWRGPS